MSIDAFPPIALKDVAAFGANARQRGTLPLLATPTGHSAAHRYLPLVVQQAHLVCCQ